VLASSPKLRSDKRRAIAEA